MLAPPWVISSAVAGTGPHSRSSAVPPVPLGPHRTPQQPHRSATGAGLGAGRRSRCPHPCGQTVCWQSHKPSANARGGRHRRYEDRIHADLRLPMPGLRPRTRSPAGIHRRRPHRLPGMRCRLASQEVRVGGHCVQGQWLLQDRQPQLGWGHQVLHRHHPSSRWIQLGFGWGFVGVVIGRVWQ